jgi:hypothetical protein
MTSRGLSSCQFSQLKGGENGLPSDKKWHL